MRFRFDMPSFIWDVYNVEAEALGANLVLFKDMAPAIDNVNPLIKSEKDLAKLKAPDPYSSGRMPMAFEILHEAKELTGVTALPCYCAPFTLASHVMTFENLIVQIQQNPEFVHKVMVFLVDEVIAPYMNALLKEFPDAPVADGSDAVDIGTTTISCQLCDMTSGDVLAIAGCMNPQIRFGEDLMSRVSYVVAKSGAVKEMNDALIEALNSLVQQTSEEAGVDRLDVVEVVIVGNPIMHHLALGIDPSELGVAPFALCTNEAVKIYAEEDLKLDIAPGSRAYFFPCIAGHVGADAAAVVLSESPQLRNEITLIVDVGTNAEIILGNKKRLLAASSPTGPAFEGAEISSGQRAAPGAIERLRIDPDTYEPTFKVIGCELWSDEDGFAESVREVGITGICGSGIIEVIGEMFLTGLLSADGVIDGAMAAHTPRIQRHGHTFCYMIHDGEPAIRIIQSDVRAIQLAKGALYAGAKLLMDRFGVDKVDRIALAGAFGSHIDTKYAMLIGMIPDCPLDKVSSAGNAAGTGARIALLNKQARQEIEELVRCIEKVETAIEPEFQTHFVKAMAFPNLARAVDLPSAKAAHRKPPSTGPGVLSRRKARQRRVKAISVK